TRSAQHCIPRWRLWASAFTAMLKGHLAVEFSNDVVPDPDDPVRLRHAITAALPRVKERRTDPSQLNWAQNLTLAPAAFDKWLRRTLQDGLFPEQPKRRGGARPVRRTEAAAFVAKHPDLTNKEISLKIEKATGKSISERTVRRARGRK